MNPAQLQTLALANYGHFTSMRVEDRGVRGLGAHLDRLVRDCARVFDVELDRDRVRGHLRDAVSDVSRPVLARVTVFDPELDVANVAADAAPKILVTLRGAGRPGPVMSLRTHVYQRELPEVKHVGLFGSMRLRREARRHGADDVLFTGVDGTICETSTANVGLLDGDRVVWPRADWLPGVTMGLLSSMVETTTELVTLDALGQVDAVFVTNAAIGVQSVRAVDGTRWTREPGGLTRLRDSYAEIQPERL